MGQPVVDRKFFTLGDLGRSTAQTLVDTNGDPVDLTGMTVRYELYLGDELIVTREATIVDAKAATVRHDWQAGDVDDAGGPYHEFWIRVDGAGKEEHFPTRGEIEVWFRSPPGG